MTTNRMNNFINSFSPLLKRLKLKKYFLEITILTVSLIITVVAMVIFINDNQKNSDREIISQADQGQVLPEKIFIEVSGSIKNPNLYEMGFGARIKDIIDKAGGLSSDADVVFFNRNFNLARFITDQEKIYIPSISEINEGIFRQNQMMLDYNSPVVINQKKVETGLSEDQSLISLNNATIEELDQLPGIGQVTASKILNGRPFTTIEDLLIRKIVNKGVFEKMKNLISL